VEWVNYSQNWAPVGVFIFTLYGLM